MSPSGRAGRRGIRRVKSSVAPAARFVNDQEGDASRMYGLSLGSEQRPKTGLLEMHIRGE